MTDSEHLSRRDIEFQVQLEVAQEAYAQHGIDALAEIIRDGSQLDNPDLRNFIADVMQRRVQNPRTKPSTYYRDWDIYHQVEDLLGQNLPLRASPKKKGAADIVRQKYPYITEDAIVKAYQTKKKSIKKLSMEIEDIPTIDEAENHGK